MTTKTAAHFSATLTGYLNNAASEEGDLRLIAGTAWDMVVLQDQSFLNDEDWRSH